MYMKYLDATITGDVLIFSADDIQAATLAIHAAATLKRTMADLDGRGVLDGLGKLSKFNQDYITTFRNDPDKLASFVFRELMKLVRDPAVHDLTKE